VIKTLTFKSFIGGLSGQDLILQLIVSQGDLFSCCTLLPVIEKAEKLS